MTGKGPVTGGSSSPCPGPQDQNCFSKSPVPNPAVCAGQGQGLTLGALTFNLKLLLGEGKLTTRRKSESRAWERVQALPQKGKHSTQLKPTPDFYMSSWNDSKLTYQQGPGACHCPLRQSSQCHPSQSPEEHCNHQVITANANTGSGHELPSTSQAQASHTQHQSLGFLSVQDNCVPFQQV